MFVHRLAPGVLVACLLACVLCLAATAEEATPAPIDLSGTWAELQVCSQLEILPVVGRVTSTSTSLLHVVMEQSESSLLLRETYCSTKIATGSLFATTTIPSAFLRSLGELARSASLDASGSTIRFVQPWYTQVRGAYLADPETDPLPTSADDPRVFDQDGDGKPGLTVRVSIIGFIASKVYIVQRVRYRMVGTVVSQDRIEGLIEWSNEQITIGATNSLFEVDISAKPNTASEKSYFILQRIGPETTCTEIAATWKSLFGR